MLRGALVGEKTTAGLAPIVLALLASACEPAPSLPVASLFGRSLSPPQLDTERSRQLADATEQAVIWHGRHLAYEFRYREAVAVFSQGVQRFPESYRLLRHRGHRWITLREFGRAVADLTRADELSRDAPDRVEPDGAPNVAGIPRSTDKSNIRYHLALAHYLRGEFALAARTWARALELQRNDDMLVSSSWWLCLSAERAGELRPADLPSREQILAPIHAEMDVIENHAYQRLLLMAKGRLTRDELTQSDVSSVEAATTTYGLAAWLLAIGEEQQALALCERIVSGASWMAFGYIGAEAELWRRGRRPAPAGP